MRSLRLFRKLTTTAGSDDRHRHSNEVILSTRHTGNRLSGSVFFRPARFFRLSRARRLPPDQGTQGSTSRLRGFHGGIYQLTEMVSARLFATPPRNSYRVHSKTATVACRTARDPDKAVMACHRWRSLARAIRSFSQPALFMMGALVLQPPPAGGYQSQPPQAMAGRAFEFCDSRINTNAPCDCRRRREALLS
jgi:hypothetical protein